MMAVVAALIEVFGSEPHYEAADETLLPAPLSLCRSLGSETYGGAMLLGVDGVCIISHGSSSERAIVHAISVVRETVEADVVGEITAAIRPPAD